MLISVILFPESLHSSTSPPLEVIKTTWSPILKTVSPLGIIVLSSLLIAIGKKCISGKKEADWATFLSIKIADSDKFKPKVVKAPSSNSWVSLKTDWSITNSISSDAKSPGEINSSTPSSSKLILWLDLLYSVLDILAIVFLAPICFAKKQAVKLVAWRDVTPINRSASETFASFNVFIDVESPLITLISKCPSAKAKVSLTGSINVISWDS